MRRAGRRTLGLIGWVAVVGLALATSGCCSRHKEKAERYKSERDKYRAQLLQVHASATRAQTEIRTLRARLEEQGREGDLQEFKQVIEVLQLLQGL